MMSGAILRVLTLFTAFAVLPVNAEVAEGAEGAELKDAPKKWTPEQIGWQSFPLKPDKTLEYKTVTGKDGAAVNLKLQVFLPEGWQASDQRPAAVFFHGGGWHGGGPDHYYPQSRYVALRGMVGISVEYRTINRFGTSPRECVKDGKSAMRWVKTHAAKLGIDPDRIVAGGGSAGGHIAAATALVSAFDEEGEDALPGLLELCPQTKILILSQSDAQQDILRAISRGAHGYLLKSASIKRITEHIASTCAGGASLDPGVARYLVERLRIKETPAPEPQDVQELFKREYEILQLLADGMVKKGIADQLSISYATVDTHIRHIYHKLDAHNAPGAVSIAHRLGLID